MDVIALQNYIIADPSRIESILSSLHLTNVKDKGKYLQFPNKNGDNLTACCIWKDNLHYENFSHGERGNIFTLVMNDLECDFPTALNRVAEWVGFKAVKQHIKPPFGGFYKRLYRQNNNSFSEVPEYPIEDLPESDGVSQKFFKDGISYQVQEQWGVRYNADNDAILIPVYRYGKLIGVKARNNDPNCLDSARWWAYLPYSKTQVLYGLDNNYSSIQKKNVVIVFESEKSVLQCASFGLYCTVAIGGHNISQTQAYFLKSLMVDRIILAFDEGICEDEMIAEAEKIACDNTLYKNKIGYIYDKDHLYMRLGSKDSPSDNGKKAFQNLLKHCVRYIDAER